MSTPEAQDLVVKLVGLITPVFHKQNQVLANHPNSYLYRTLGSLVDVEGYYLESEPCLVCNDPELHFVNVCCNLLFHLPPPFFNIKKVKFGGGGGG